MERQLIIDKKNCPDYETIYFVASASAPKEIRDHLTHLMVEKIDDETVRISGTDGSRLHAATIKDASQFWSQADFWRIVKVTKTQIIVSPSEHEIRWPDTTPLYDTVNRFKTVKNAARQASFKWIERANNRAGLICTAIRTMSKNLLINTDFLAGLDFTSWEIFAGKGEKNEGNPVIFESAGENRTLTAMVMPLRVRA